MSERTSNDRFLIVVGAMAAVAVVTLLGLGLSAAVTTGQQLAISATWVPILSGTAAVGLGAVVLLVALSAMRGATKVIAPQLKNPDAAYVQYIGVSVAVLSGAMGRLYEDDWLVAAVLAAVAGVAATLAAKLIKTRPLLGVGLYVVVPLGSVAIAVSTGRLDLIAWLAERTPRDWVLLGALAVIAVGIPASVAAVERYRGSRTWQFRGRLRMSSER